jgi:predicted enzyme related to lactoylglutathione lyase
VPNDHEAEAITMTTLRHGKICHVELPADDPQKAAEFYARVFDWTVRSAHGTYFFEDSTDEVSGHWVPHREATPPGVLVYVWVDDLAAAVERVVAEGCEIVQPIGGDPGELTARFRDPGGNVVGLYQEPPQ